MGYLIAQILACLMLAALIGAIIGWWLKKIACDGRFAELEEDYLRKLTTLETERDAFLADYNNSNQVVANFVGGEVAATSQISKQNDQSNWPYPVEEVEGIGPAYGERLRSINIDTTERLLLGCREASRQVEVSKVVKVEPFVVGKWVSMSDMMRVSGIHGQYAELLEASGIASVGELARQDAPSLAGRMVSVNAEEHRTPTVPDSETVASWIEIAKDLPSVIKSLVPK
ncbi:MAG: DUF4332 domain-containing protein [Gammaproteobacteria bacterium]